MRHYTPTPPKSSPICRRRPAPRALTSVGQPDGGRARRALTSAGPSIILFIDMRIRTAIGMAVLFAHMLFAAAFPGGPVRCDEGGGVVRIEPAHGPHAPSCCPAPIETSTLELHHRDHEHDGCVDTDADGRYAPKTSFKMRPPAASSIMANPPSCGETTAAGLEPAPHAAFPPVARHISSTVLRT